MGLIELAWNNLAGVFDGSLLGSLFRAVLAIIGGIGMLILYRGLQGLLRNVMNGGG